MFNTSAHLLLQILKNRICMRPMLYTTYILLHGVECNNYGEILHEWAFVFHEPTASEIQPTNALMSHHITLHPMQ